MLDATNNSLTGLPASLPPSLTHVYLGRNPLRGEADNLSAALLGVVRLAALDVSLLNVGLSLGCRTAARADADCENPGGDTSYDYTRVVPPPTPCRVGGGASPCTFTLRLYDTSAQPARTGGLVTGLELGNASGTPGSGSGGRVPMVDNRDGSFSAAVNASWVTSQGPHTFTFWLHGTDISAGLEWHAAGYFVDDRAWQLRTVEFLPIACAPNMHADETGGECLCDEGFAPDTGGGGGASARSCHRLCGAGTKQSEANSSRCECTGSTYDTDTTGILVCVPSDTSLPPTQQPRFVAALAAARARQPQKYCAPCPTECANCTDGVATLSHGWRLATARDAELRSRLVDARFVPLVAFRCPYGGEDCPALRLTPLPSNGSGAGRVEVPQCLREHRGVLCAECREGYSRKGSSDNHCKICSSTESLGMPVGWLLAIALLLAACACAVLYWQRALLRKAKTTMGTNLRIMLGAGQVLSLLSGVLKLVFPEQARLGLGFVTIFVADVGSLGAFECYGFTWFDKWRLVVGAVPTTALVGIGMRWAWLWGRDRRRHRADQMAAAADGGASVEWSVEAVAASSAAAAKRSAECTGLLFFCAMLLYPQISTQILAALRCRDLGPDVSVLEVDYAISCLSPVYASYERTAVVLVLLWVLGIPLGLLLALLHHWRQSRRRWEATARGGAGQQLQERLLGQPPPRRPAAHDDEVQREPETLVEYNYGRVRLSFGFCVDDYRPGCYWFEPVDMLRKLALSGLLQFVEPGTAAQVFFGCVLAFCSFGMQLWLQPYREAEANRLKMLVDTQIFLTFLLSFILRVLPSDTENSLEPFGPSFYGWVLVVSLLALCGSALALTLALIRRRRRHGLLAGPGVFEAAGSLASAEPGAAEQQRQPEPLDLTAEEGEVTSTVAGDALRVVGGSE